MRKVRSVRQKLERTPEETGRIKALREKYQREKPTPEDLEAEGAEPSTLAAYLDTAELLDALKKAREAAGLSLADVAERAGMDKGFLSKVENGRQGTPTLPTLFRYARAINQRIVFSLAAETDAGPAKK